jgi:O-antigen ligase
MNRTYEIIDRIIEIEIYLYIIFIFLTKGEGIRNILLFSSFFLWLATLRHRENKHILAESVSIVFWGFIITILISVIFSLDPLYSFKSLRGYPLKSVMIFCLVSTVLSDEKRLKNIIYLFSFLLLFTISISYYSFIAHDLTVMYPDTALRHANPNRLAVDMGTLIPFAFILLLNKKDFKLKIVIAIIILAGISAIILSASRGGSAAFICTAGILFIYILRKKKFNIRLLLAGIILVVMISGIVSYYSTPRIKMKFALMGQHLASFHNRIEIWAPLVSAASERPVFGWGHGNKLFIIDKPFENTPYKVAPVTHHPSNRNPHNAFLRILFHQGIVGLISYVILLMAASRVFWKNAFNSENFENDVLSACASVLIGTYIVHGIVVNSHLPGLALILGIGLAAKNVKKA